MACAPHALHGRGNSARRVDLADEVDGADVDAKLQRGCGDKKPDLSGLELALSLKPQRAGEGAVVGCNVLRPKPFSQLEGKALHHGTRVDENER